jgi:hypothetical protein
MKPWIGAQIAFDVKRFYKNGESLGSLSVNLEQSLVIIAIIAFH